MEVPVCPPVPTLSSKSRKPFPVRCGNVKVMIYRGQTKAAGQSYDRWSVVYRDLNGQRIRRNFSELQEARIHAELTATRLANGQTDVASLKNADVAELHKARETLKPFNLSVSTAADNLVAALKRLPANTSLWEVVDYFAKRHQENAPKRTVEQVVAEFIADRQCAECSAVHLRDLGVRLNRFARAFAMPITSVTAPLVQEFITTLQNDHTRKPAAARSKENMLRMISSLFNFARRRKYVSAELALEVAEVSAPKKKAARIGIYSSQEIAAMLAAADQQIRPALAIAVFAGLRLAEVARLDWREIRLASDKAEDRVIVVGDEIAKTAARRLAPISDNLLAWLAPASRPFGPVNPCADDPLGNALGDRFERAARRAGVKWVRNGLRHSYISYRVATLKDVPAVALECGNSPNIIFRSYRALASETEGRQWFSVLPSEPAGNVISIAAAQ